MRRLLITCICAAVLAGCATPESTRNFKLELQSGNIPAATERAVKESAPDKEGQPGNLLWALEAGTLLRYSTLSERSTRMLDGAEVLMKEDDTRNVVASGGQQVAAVLTNDNVLPYSPNVYDTVMLNTYKALNFWQQGDYANARVEWNRVDDRQRRAAEHFEAEIAKQRDAVETSDNADLVNRSLAGSDAAFEKAGVDVSQWTPYAGYINPAALYLHGLYFLLNSEGKADYEKARTSLERAFALTKHAQVKADLASARRPRTLKPAVWILLENGMAASKRELRIDLPLFLVTGAVHYTGIALPIIEDGVPAYPHIAVGRQQSQPLADMDTIIKGEFKTRFNAILVREIIRATAKTVLQKQMNDQNPWLGLAAAVAQAASTQADLRSWITLPHDFQLMQVPYPKDNVLTLTLPGIEASIDVPLPERKAPVLVYVRALNTSTTPSIQVLASK
ncbi:COG3014 family protein [Castellaniella daejeonensis]|jgi:hypothetical protein|uniref:COG3014 family protein n=1 Tax=Castellaniella daejeonensis TaxID=659013 RepID=A0ABP3DK22_9BURK|nr:hypothetical protein [Castellaniella sp.]HET8703142.1 hypothetical protein [Castellaniella sp.]